MGYWGILRNRPFSLLALAALFSRFGDVLAGLGFLFATYELTGSKTLTTGVAVAEVLPYLLFGLVGGALSDLLPKLRVMVATDVLRAVVQTVTTILFATGLAGYPVLLAVVFLLQLGGCFFNPCSRSVIVQVVGQDGRVAANSVLSVVDNLSLIVGPLLATAILTATGVTAFFVIDGVTYVISAIALAVMVRAAGADDTAEVKSLREAGGAIRRIPSRMAMFFGELRLRPALSVLFGSTLLSILCSTWPWRVGFLFKTVPNPDSDKAFYTVMLTVYSITGLVVSLVLPMVFRAFRLPHYWGAVGLWAAGLLILGCTGGPVLTVAGVVVIGVGITTAAQARMYMLQHSLPPGVMGQGFSAAAVLLYAGDTISLAVFGGLADSFAATTLIAAAGVLLAVSVVAQWTLIRVKWPSTIRTPEEEAVRPQA